MKEVKKFLKGNMKIVVAFIIGIIISGTTVFAATILLTSDQVEYYNTNSGMTATNVKDALDELYEKAESGDGELVQTLIYTFPGGTTAPAVNLTTQYDCVAFIVDVARAPSVLTEPHALNYVAANSTVKLVGNSNNSPVVGQNATATSRTLSVPANGGNAVVYKVYALHFK